MSRRRKGFSARAVAWAAGALAFLLWFQQSGYRTYRDLYVKRVALANEEAASLALEREVEQLNREVEEFMASPEPTLKSAREKLGLHPKDEIVIKVPGKR